MFNPSDPTDSGSSLSESFQRLQISGLRRKRDKYMKLIEAKKRESRLFSLCKKCVLEDYLPNHSSQEDTFGQGVPMQEFIADCQKKTYTSEQLSELVTSLNSSNLYRQHFGVIGLRKLISDENNPNIQPIIDTGIILKLVGFLGREDEQKLQLEAAWALTNIAARTSEQTKEVVANGAIPELIKLLESSSKEVRSQATWALANIASDNVDFRDAVRKGGAICPLIKIMEEALSKRDLQSIREGNWALSSLCRKKPLPPYEEVKDVLPIAAKVIMSQEVAEILQDALWCLVNLSYGGEERIQEVIKTGVVPFLVKFLDYPCVFVRIPCLRVLGNLLTGNAEQVDHLLSSPGILDKLFNTLKHQDWELRREGAWILSSIATRTTKIRELMVENASYLELLFSLGVNEKVSLEVRGEVARMVNNIVTTVTPEQLKVFLEKETFGYFEKLIEEKDDSLQDIGLTGIRTILALEGDQAYYGVLLKKKESRTREAIEKLQNRAMRISKLTSEILDFVDSVSEEKKS